MKQRLQVLGIVMIASGIFGFGVAGYTGLRTMEGITSLQRFSEAQAVNLSYNEDGQLVDHGDPAAAQKIVDLVKNDWGYALQMSDLNPNDPLVNTASEYMYEMGAITEHTLTSKVQVTLAADVTKDDGTVVKAGTYEYQNPGKYYSQFNRMDPIEGAARGQIWSGTALSLIGQLGVGAVTANTLQIGLGLVGVIGGLAGTLLLLGLGLIWVAAKAPEGAAARA